MKNFLWLLGLVFFLSFLFVSATSYSGNTDTTVNTKALNCTKTDTTSFWTNNTDGSIIWVFNSSYKSTGGVCLDQGNNNATCCPNGYSCSGGQCVAQNSSDCTGLTTQSSCETADFSFYSQFFSGDDTYKCNNGSTSWQNGDLSCANVTICGCVWNASVSSSKKCGFKKEIQSTCPTDNSGNSGTSIECDWIETSSVDHCNDPQGKITVNLSASGPAKRQGLSWCQDKSQDYACSVSVKLPFFDGFTFVLSGMAIALVYFILRRK